MPRGDCIFTNTSTSLSLRRRQCGHRYAIRAGRNLPDKEFRYLRTVIVTAAVYRGFDQELAPHHLTFRHRAGVTPYTSTFVLAECCVFVKQSQPPFHCGPSRLRLYAFTYQGRTLSRSYGANLPSSFTRDHSRALEFSSRLPVSVYGTVVPCLKLRGFSWQPGISDFAQKRARTRFSDLARRIFLSSHPTSFNPHFRSRAHLSSCVTPSQHVPVQEC